MVDRAREIPGNRGVGVGGAVNFRHPQAGTAVIDHEPVDVGLGVFCVDRLGVEEDKIPLIKGAVTSIGDLYFHLRAAVGEVEVLRVDAVKAQLCGSDPVDALPGRCDLVEFIRCWGPGGIGRCQPEGGGGKGLQLRS